MTVIQHKTWHFHTKTKFRRDLRGNEENVYNELNISTQARTVDSKKVLGGWREKNLPFFGEYSGCLMLWPMVCKVEWKKFNVTDWITINHYQGFALIFDVLVLNVSYQNSSSSSHHANHFAEARFIQLGNLIVLFIFYKSTQTELQFVKFLLNVSRNTESVMHFCQLFPTGISVRKSQGGK